MRLVGVQENHDEMLIKSLQVKDTTEDAGLQETQETQAHGTQRRRDAGTRRKRNVISAGEQHHTSR